MFISEYNADQFIPITELASESSPLVSPLVTLRDGLVKRLSSIARVRLHPEYMPALKLLIASLDYIQNDLKPLILSYLCQFWELREIKILKEPYVAFLQEDGVFAISHTHKTLCSLIPASSKEISIDDLPVSFAPLRFAPTTYLNEANGALSVWQGTPLTPSTQIDIDGEEIQDVRLDSNFDAVVVFSLTQAAFVGLQVRVIDKKKTYHIWKEQMFPEQSVRETRLLDQSTLLFVTKVEIVVGSMSAAPKRVNHESAFACSNRSLLFSYDKKGETTVFELPSLQVVAKIKGITGTVKAAFASERFLVTITQTVENKETAHWISIVQIGSWETHSLIKTSRFSEVRKLQCQLFENTLFIAYGQEKHTMRCCQLPFESTPSF